MIRKASAQDAPTVAKLMVGAMEDLAKQFRSTQDKNEAVILFAHFCGRPANQYSFEHTLVYELNHDIVGAITAYDGAKIKELRQPFFDHIQMHYHPEGFEMELESQAGEFYIDTLSVDQNFQGRGIGQALIVAAITWAKNLGHQQIGLLVDEENPKAKNLYERLGFKETGYKNLMGKVHHYLTFNVG